MTYFTPESDLCWNFRKNDGIIIAYETENTGFYRYCNDSVTDVWDGAGTGERSRKRKWRL